MKPITIFSFVCLLSGMFFSFSPALAQDQEIPGIELNREKGDDLNPKKIDPRNPRTLKFLNTDLVGLYRTAVDAYQNKKYEDAAKYFILILKHKFDDPMILFSLACCYGRMNEPDLAALALQKAVQNGFHDAERLTRTADFQPLQSSEKFRKMEEALLSYLQQLGEEIYIETPYLMKCRIHLPKNHDATKPYPLLIGLHGRGGSAEDFGPVWAKIKNPQFILVTPEAPYVLPPSISGNTLSHAWGLVVKDRQAWDRADELIVESIRQISLQVSQRHKIGPIYLCGFSQGVSYAYLAAAKLPGIFSGLIAFAGYFPEKDMKAEDIGQMAKTLPVFIAHGTRDEAIAFSEGKKTKKRLDELGFTVRFDEFNGGHTISADLLQEALRWLQKK